MTGKESDQPLSLLGVDMERPNAARMYDYWLGGSYNFAADRELCNRLAGQLPSGRDGIWSNRAFLRRVIQFLVVDCGVTQFLDLGSGIPTAGNVHEIAQRADPEARVVYVDIDPMAVTHAQHILAGNARCAAIHADLRKPDEVLGAPEVGRLLDLGRPVAVSLFSALGVITDAEDPRSLLRHYMSEVVAGSYLSLSQIAEDQAEPTTQAATLREYEQATGARLTNRDPAQIATFFDGLDLCEPGVVLVDRWRPDQRTPIDPMPFYGAVARKADSGFLVG